VDRPLIPLGSRGKLRGTDYEVIGFQRRGIVVEGISYYWHEYVLFNPYKATRYSPNTTAIGTTSVFARNCRRRTCLGQLSREIYKHFQTADANTNFVLGEFPWQVRVGEHATVTEYVKPPRVLSSEKTANEVTWSIGEYMYGADIWKSFNLPGAPPQRSAYTKTSRRCPRKCQRHLAAFAAFAVLLLVLLAVLTSSQARARCSNPAIAWTSANQK